MGCVPPPLYSHSCIARGLYRCAATAARPPDPRPKDPGWAPAIRFPEPY